MLKGSVIIVHTVKNCGSLLVSVVLDVMLFLDHHTQHASRVDVAMYSFKSITRYAMLLSLMSMDLFLVVRSHCGVRDVALSTHIVNMATNVALVNVSIMSKGNVLKPPMSLC